jgi:selenocysteine-specific elongation factor
MLVVEKGFFRLTKYLLVDFYYLPYNEKPLKSRIVAQFHYMTMKTTAELYFLNVDKVLPGSKVFAMVKLDRPFAFSYRDPYVIRGFGIYTTMGGGIVLHPYLKEINRNKINDDYIKTLISGDLEQICALFIKEHEENGLSISDVMSFLNISLKDAQKVLDNLLDKSFLVEDKKTKRFFHIQVYNSLIDKVLENIKRYHTENPLKSGINKEELLAKTGGFESLFNLALKALIENKKIISEGETVRLFDFVPGGENKVFQPLENLLKDSGLQTEEPLRLSEILNMEEKKIKDMLTTLVKNGRVIKIKDNYYLHRDVFEDFKEKVLAFFKSKEILTPQDVRVMFNISRKYMIPLLEYLDSIKMTIRVQEGRRLRRQ